MLKKSNSRRAILFAAGLALAGRFSRPAPPPRTVEGLARMLGAASAGTVSPLDIAWEPSPGILSEVLWGRRILFLSRTSPDAPRDLFRARVRVTLEGRPVRVSGLSNLSATPLGDEQRLVIDGERAAFATASYGKTESVTLLDLTGKPRATGAGVVDFITSSITNWRETGTASGIGRTDVALERPEQGVMLAFDGGRLLIAESSGVGFAVDAATGALAADPEIVGARVNAEPALAKRPILWAVDTVRAEIGP